MFSKKRQRILLRNITIIVVITAGLILTTQLLLQNRVSENITRSYLAEVTDKAKKHIRQFYLPLEKTLLISAQWGNAGLLDPENTTNINAKFFPILDQIEQISAIKIAFSDQRIFTITRYNKRYRTFLFNPLLHKDKQVERKWTTLAAPDREPRKILPCLTGDF